MSSCDSQQVDAKKPGSNTLKQVESTAHCFPTLSRLYAATVILISQHALQRHFDRIETELELPGQGLSLATYTYIYTIRMSP